VEILADRRGKMVEGMTRVEEQDKNKGYMLVKLMNPCRMRYIR